jgi:hypothetical protein
VAQCLDNVGRPRDYWRAMPTMKFLAAAALIAGIWVPYLGLVATLGVIAISMHVRAQDFGRNLFVNASGMLALSLTALALDCVRFARGA